MSVTSAADMMKQLTQASGPLAYGPERSRLLLRVQRALGTGRPVTSEGIARYAADLGLTLEEADTFLRTTTERDADDNITGAMGISLNETPHQLTVDGTRLFAWCAGDTFFIPAILERTADIESTSPVSEQTIRLRISPDGVEQVSPPGAVVSMVVVDPETADTSSVAAIWGNFCHHIFFFASREEAEQWVAGRRHFEILPVEEVNEMARLFSARLLENAA